MFLGVGFLRDVLCSLHNIFLLEFHHGLFLSIIFVFGMLSFMALSSIDQVASHRFFGLQ